MIPDGYLPEVRINLPFPYNVTEMHLHNEIAWPIETFSLECEKSWVMAYTKSSAKWLITNHAALYFHLSTWSKDTMHHDVET